LGGLDRRLGSLDASGPRLRSDLSHRSRPLRVEAPERSQQKHGAVARPSGPFHRSRWGSTDPIGSRQGASSNRNGCFACLTTGLAVVATKTRHHSFWNAVSFHAANGGKGKSHPMPRGPGAKPALVTHYKPGIPKKERQCTRSGLGFRRRLRLIIPGDPVKSASQRRKYI
jgi:hypothetical protein